MDDPNKYSLPRRENASHICYTNYMFVAEPQPEQNFAPACRVTPQFEQCAGSAGTRVPQLLQNFAPAGRDRPQFVQPAVAEGGAFSMSTTIVGAGPAGIFPMRGCTGGMWFVTCWNAPGTCGTCRTGAWKLSRCTYIVGGCCCGGGR